MKMKLKKLIAALSIALALVASSAFAGTPSAIIVGQNPDAAEKKAKESTDKKAKETTDKAAADAEKEKEKAEKAAKKAEKNKKKAEASCWYSPFHSSR